MAAHRHSEAAAGPQQQEITRNRMARRQAPAVAAATEAPEMAAPEPPASLLWSIEHD
jgi:hypothetical protein